MMNQMIRLTGAQFSRLSREEQADLVAEQEELQRELDKQAYDVAMMEASIHDDDDADYAYDEYLADRREEQEGSCYDDDYGFNGTLYSDFL